MTAVSGQARSVDKMVLSVEQAEGRGARVRRSIGRSELSTLDPFLLLDHFNVKPPGGFPDHPHRGFETVTYMINGSFTHEDFTKHKGIIGPGDLQWMTAGRGVLHSEIPGPEGGEGLQLWVNLAAKDKMVPADYQELRKPSIPVAKQNGVTATVIAGECLGIKSVTGIFEKNTTRSFTMEHTLFPAVSPGFRASSSQNSGEEPNITQRVGILERRIAILEASNVRNGALLLGIMGHLNLNAEDVLAAPPPYEANAGEGEAAPLGEAEHLVEDPPIVQRVRRRPAVQPTTEQLQRARQNDDHPDGAQAVQGSGTN